VAGLLRSLQRKIEHAGMEAALAALLTACRISGEIVSSPNRIANHLNPLRDTPGVLPGTDSEFNLQRLVMRYHHQLSAFSYRSEPHG